MYEIELQVKDEHINGQEILDSLYYPFYFEACREHYFKNVLNIDLVESYQQGINFVLTEYTIKFKRSLKKNDHIKVTLELLPIPGSNTRMSYKQFIICENKIAAEAFFTMTAVPVGGGKPIIIEKFILPVA